MLTTRRRKLILERLARDSQVVAKDLAAEWGTSEDTIRRDLRDLAQAGRLVHPLRPRARQLPPAPSRP